MDSGPDSSLINSPSINSVLKPPKPRVPLKDLMAAVPDEDNTATRKPRVPLKDLMAAFPEEDNTAARKRRVSFANVNKIKEFSAGAESMVVCQTPAYEEPFSVSSDSSYPSGVDGWTPAKEQPLVDGKPPIYPEKENLSIQSLRMSTGMDLTSVVGNSVRNTRYSVNGMDLTEAASSHETYTDQRTRISLGMDLTNVAGHPSQNTRYSVSGMDLTRMASTNQVLVDQRTRFSMGMDFTNVVGHSTQSSRYSINGMDLTEAVNPHQTLLDQRSARFSVGMDMTNIVGNPMNTMRYSCNDMDLTEAANPYCYKKQSCEEGFSANVSMDDSDTLELTEAVDGVQFSVVSPKYKISNVGLTENVLYSVNNTRYSVNGMDMTSAAGSRFSAARRKSSRYSWVNVDLTEVINNSCDDLELTQAIGDPRIKAGSISNSMCKMDLTEGIVDEGRTRLAPHNMEHTSVVGEHLEYSADTESIMNMTKSTSNNLDPPIYDKENVLPNQSLKLIGAPTILTCEDRSSCVDSKLCNMSLCTAAYETLSEVALVHPIIGNEHCHLQNTMPLNNSQSIKQGTCEHLLNESPNNTEITPDAFKENLPSSVVNESKLIKKDSQSMSEKKEFHAVENNSESISLPSVQKEGVEGIVLNEKVKSCVNNETLSKLEISVGHLSNEINKNEKKISLNASNCNITEQKHADALNKSLKLDKREFGIVDNLEYGSSGKENVQQHNSCTTYKEDLTFQNVSKNKEPIIEQQNLIEDAMDISITDNSGLEKHESIVTEELHSSEIGNPETTLKCPDRVCSLNESVMNMSTENRSLIKEVEDEENIDEQVKNNDVGYEKDVPVPITDDEINHPESNTSSLIHEENHQPLVENITANVQSVELNVSQNTPLNLSSRSVLCNITMSRGRSKSLIISPDISLEIRNEDSMIVKNEAITSIKTTPVTLRTCVNDDGLNQSKNNLKHGINSLLSEASHEKRGKRSFEAALEPENDTEESPIKQLCLSREEPSTEYEILSNVTAPSFLMETVAASNETFPCLGQHEITGMIHQFKPKPTSPTEREMSLTPASESTCETKQEFSLRMDDSLIRNVSGNSLRNEVIDLCESSFDATTTEVRELINNSRYKTKNVYDDEIVTERNEVFNNLSKKVDSSGFNDLSFDHGQLDQIPRPCVIKEPCNNTSFNMDDAIGINVFERKMESMCTDPLPPLHHLKSGSRRKREKVRTLGNNSYAADFISNLVEIRFSIDSFDNVNSVSYHSICTGGDTVIGEYLLKQARNYVLPEKGSDLILQLQSTNKSYLACLARSVNIICKYHNGSIKGDILTLEVASCRNHFWTLIDVNIKHPQYLNQADITISKQKIGELKLTHVRQVFNHIEKNQDQLLNFAKAITELQYNN